MALALAVEDGGATEAPWRGIRLARVFPPSSIFTVQRATGFTRILGILAAVIVFFPIGWTWIGLRAAVSQYREALIDRSAEGQSLLQLWTSGFDGALPSHLTLPSVALGSALLIAVSTLLVITERLVSTRSEWNRREEQRNLEAELSSALLAAELTLALNTADTPEKGLDLVRDSIDAVVAANMALADTADRLSTAAGEMAAQTAAASNHFEHAAASIGDGLRQAAVDAGGTLHGAIQQAGTSFQKAASASVLQLSDSVNELSVAASEQARSAAQSTTLAATLGTAAESIRDTTRSFGDQVASSTNDLRSTMAHTLTTTAENITSNTRTVADQMVSSADELRSSVTPAVTRIGDEVTALSLFASRLHDALTHHTSAAQHQISELTQIRASLAQMTAPHPNAQQFQGNVASAEHVYQSQEI